MTGPVSVVVDDRNLPTDVQISQGLRAEDYERQFAEGYGEALKKRIEVRIESGDKGVSTVPSRRNSVLEFLTARSWDEYMDLLSESFGRTFRAESKQRDEAGRPGVVLLADGSALTKLDVSINWAKQVGPGVVAHVIVECADEIRNAKNSKKFNRDDGQLSDEQLEEMLRAHLPSLLAES